MKRMGVIIMAALMLMGCATPVNWSERVGVYTYNQAVADYGPPVSLATLDDGSKVAEWTTKRSAVVSTPGPLVYGPPFYSRSGYYYGYYGRGWPNYKTAYFPGQFLRLEFGANGRLKAWQEYSKYTSNDFEYLRVSTPTDTGTVFSSNDLGTGGNALASNRNGSNAKRYNNSRRKSHVDHQPPDTVKGIVKPIQTLHEAPKSLTRSLR